MKDQSSIKPLVQTSVPTVTAPLDIGLSKKRSGKAKDSPGGQDHLLETVADLSQSSKHIFELAQARTTSPFTFLNVHGFLGLGNEFIAEIIGGLLEGCNFEDRDLSLQRTLTLDRYREKLLEGDVAGLVLHAFHGHPVVDLLAGSGIPVVAVCDAIADFPSVVVDDYTGAKLMAHYLSDRGYRRILYRKIVHRLETSRRRFEGFMEVAELRKLDVTVFEIDNDFVLLPDEISYLNDVGNHPCAVTGWRDLSMMPVAKFCRAAGLRIPDDVALAGFDGMSMVPEVNGILTTVVAPWADVARKSISVLTAMHRGDDVPEETVLPVRLRIGDTT